MLTGDQYLNVVAKRLLGTQSFKDYFLDYLKDSQTEILKRTWSRDGTFHTTTKVAISGAGANKIDLTSDREGTDGSGHVLKTDSTYCADVFFENSTGSDYDVALKYVERPDGVQINPRTGWPEYLRWEETWGEVDDPHTVTDQGGGVVRLRLPTSLCDNDRTHAGRKCLVWMKSPAKSATTEGVAIEELTVAFGGGFNYIDTTSASLGQDTISTTEADYSVLLLGPTIARENEKDLEAAADYWYIGEVAGNTSGTPFSFDTTDQWLITKSLSDYLDHLVYDNVENTFTEKQSFTAQASKSALRLVPYAGFPNDTEVGGIFFHSSLKKSYIRRSSATNQWWPIDGISGDPIYNIKDPRYNAQGDDSTNDSTAVSSAISHCAAAGGGSVFFPPGDYVIDTTVSWDSSVSLIGAGSQCTSIKINHASLDLFTCSGATTQGTQKVAGLTITAKQANSGALIVPVAGSRIAFEDCHLGGPLVQGSVIKETGVSAEYLSINRCTLEIGVSADEIIYLAYADIIISDSTVVYPATYSEATGSIYNSFGNLTVTNTHFDNSLCTSGSYRNLACVSSNTSLHVTGCKFSESGGATVAAMRLVPSTTGQTIHEAANSVYCNDFFDLSGVSWPTTYHDSNYHFGTRHSRVFINESVSGDNIQVPADEYGVVVVEIDGNGSTKNLDIDRFFQGTEFTLIILNKEGSDLTLNLRNNTREDTGTDTLPNNESWAYHFRSVTFNGDTAWSLVSEYGPVSG